MGRVDNPLQTSNSVTPHVIEPVPNDPDFNGDGKVDGADFLRWQLGYGVTTASQSQGDANGDARVDAADLAAWEEAFGGDVVEPTLLIAGRTDFQPLEAPTLQALATSPLRARRPAPREVAFAGLAGALE
ncbi:MAG: hypothetical protein KDA61_13105, partial [Planctomycetales bacterium]|nr:hypothetical protein [Planctomycetales bacterium]